MKRYCNGRRNSEGDDTEIYFVESLTGLKTRKRAWKAWFLVVSISRDLCTFRAGLVPYVEFGQRGATPKMTNRDQVKSRDKLCPEQFHLMHLVKCLVADDGMLLGSMNSMPME